MININLLPWREAQAEKAKKHFLKSIILYTVLAILILILSYILISSANERYRNKVAEINKRVTELVATTKQFKKIEGLREKSIYFMQVVNNVNQRRFLALEVLNALKEILPKEVALDSLSIKKNTVIFTGYSPVNVRTVDFEDNILKSKLFESAQIIQVQLQKKKTVDLYQFKIVAKLADR